MFKSQCWFRPLYNIQHPYSKHALCRKRDYIHITVNSINVHSISRIILSIGETVGWDVGN